MAEATIEASQISRNFKTFAELEAFQDGILVLSGLLGEHQNVVIGNPMPLDLTGYQLTVTLNKGE